MREELTVAVPVILLPCRTVGRTVRDIVEPRAAGRRENTAYIPVRSVDLTRQCQVVVQLERRQRLYLLRRIKPLDHTYLNPV